MLCLIADLHETGVPNFFSTYLPAISSNKPFGIGKPNSPVVIADSEYQCPVANAKRSWASALSCLFQVSLSCHILSPLLYGHSVPYTFWLMLTKVSFIHSEVSQRFHKFCLHFTHLLAEFRIGSGRLAYFDAEN